MTLKDTLFALSGAVGAGTVRTAADLAFDMLSKYVPCEKSDNLTVIGKLKGKSDYTLLLDAHIDEVAMIVTHVDTDGFLTCAKAGGIDLRCLPARVVTVHGKTPIPAVFCSTPPHLSDGDAEYDDIAKLKLDTGLGEKARECVSVGDYVTFRAQPCELLGERVTGKSFDDRAGVACLIELAKRLCGKELPVSVAFVACDMEELGMRGSRTAAFSVSPNEAIALDVSFGDGPGIADEECGKLGGGAMIGISPVIDRRISDRLLDIASEKGLCHQTEVMGGRTGTDADVISLTREGVPCGVVSIPLRNMHSDVELLDLGDLTNVCDLLEGYILSGGIMND